MEKYASLDIPPYIARKIEGDYVLWFPKSNHYVQVKEPVWDVAQLLTETGDFTQTILRFNAMYDLPEPEAKRFVGEVIDSFRQIGNQPYTHPKIGDKVIKPLVNAYQAHQTKYYAFADKVVKVSYPDANNYEHIHSIFFNLETEASEAHSNFQIVKDGNLTYLIKDGHQAWSWEGSAVAYLKGRLFMEILGLMYDKSEADWLTAIHASAISNGRKTILLTAESQSGKSTFGALCREQGYHILTDDYVPVDLQTRHVLAFPMAHSIRKNSFKLLQPLMDELNKEGSGHFFIRQSTGTKYIPSEPIEVLSKIRVPVKAIVFIKYNPDVSLEFHQISKLDCLRKIFDRAWMPPHKENVQTFLDWILELDFYDLEYSDAPAAMQKMKELFGD